ncbi:hypothetical protein CEXT_28321 [Caerostris extrusa]|uniref:Uncharacterized protein n=1 Tax=Caerostris extrusa TaxID=172846 RepID=A0AAV4TK56_CAEEX|nr:hypothetical protein CEXT_28321 [Caerostris extrusa]
MIPPQIILEIYNGSVFDRPRLYQRLNEAITIGLLACLETQISGECHLSIVITWPFFNLNIKGSKTVFTPSTKLCGSFSDFRSAANEQAHGRDKALTELGDHLSRMKDGLELSKDNDKDVFTF